MACPPPLYQLPTEHWSSIGSLLSPPHNFSWRADNSHSYYLLLSVPTGILSFDPVFSSSLSNHHLPSFASLHCAHSCSLPQIPSIQSLPSPNISTMGIKGLPPSPRWRQEQVSSLVLWPWTLRQHHPRQRSWRSLPMRHQTCSRFPRRKSHHTICSWQLWQLFW